MAKVKSRVLTGKAATGAADKKREELLAKRREYAARARAKRREKKLRMQKVMQEKVKVRLQPQIEKLAQIEPEIADQPINTAEKLTLGRALVDLVLACRQARVKSFKMEGIDIEFSQDYPVKEERSGASAADESSKPTIAYPAPVAMQGDQTPEQPNLFDSNTRELLRDNDLMISDPMGFEKEMINQVEAAEHGRTANGYDPNAEGAFY